MDLQKLRHGAGKTVYRIMPDKRAAAGRPLFPFVDLKAQFAAISTEILTSVTSVLERQHFILGREVEALENEIADLVSCRFAIGCASGSDSLLLSLIELGIIMCDASC